MTIPALVTFAQAVTHLQIASPPPGSPEQADLQQKIDAATELVCDYVSDRQPADPAWVTTIEGWTVTTAPQVVRAAVLLALADLARYRGDDGDGDKTREAGFLPLAVRNLLVRYRDPVLA